MKKFVMCKGLPASGKSTWAEGLVRKDPVNVVRVNQDLLRLMLHAEWFTVDRQKTLEPRITTMRNATIGTLMQLGVETIISDDTNLHPSAESTFRTLAAEHGYEFCEKDFTDVPAKECIQRDLKRERSVGHKVINRMNLRYLTRAPLPIVYDPEKLMAIIVDIDGTIAHMAGRGPYDYSLVDTDVVDPVVCDLVREARVRGDKILVVSGRDGDSFDLTTSWLVANDIPYDQLLMRVAGDKRDDGIVKREIFEENIQPHYNIRFVLDDRDRVVQMWRAIGLKCLQVSDGDF